MCALQIIQAKNTYLCKAPTIGLKTTPDQLESSFEDVDKLVGEFEMVASCILVGIKSAEVKTPPSGEDPLDKLVETSKRDIFLSFVKTEIPALLGKKSFSNAQSISELKLALEKVIGKVEPIDKMKKLKHEFNQLTRRIAVNESFEDYFDRLLAKANEITETDYKLVLAADQWTSDLRPMDIETLDMFPSEWNEEADDVATVKAKCKVLDDRKMFRKVESSSHKLEIDAIRSELGAKVDNLTKQLAENSLKHEEMTNKLMQRLEEKMTVQTNLVNTIPKPSKPEVNDKPKESIAKPAGGKKPWMNKSNYCNYCGGRRCKKGAKCDGNPGLYCMFCNMSGHAVTSAHFHGSKN